MIAVLEGIVQIFLAIMLFIGVIMVFLVSLIIVGCLVGIPLLTIYALFFILRDKLLEGPD